MKPPFTITTGIVNLCSDLSRIVGQCEGLNLTVPTPQLRRHTRIRTIQSSLAIEGNHLSESQVTDIIDNKRVLGPAKDIQEVKSAIEAYSRLREFDVFNIKSFLHAHGIMLKGLVSDIGRFRAGGVGIMQGKKVIHMAPSAAMVPGLIDSLFSFLKQEKDINLLIRSCVFHYEVEFIHPFSDGNGRMGRLWQSAILTRVHPVFEYIPVESLIKRRQKEYYNSLRTCDVKGDATVFVEFMLETVKKAAEEFIVEIKQVTQTSQTRLEYAREHFERAVFSRNDYMKLHKMISTATASRDLALGVRDKTLRRTGDKVLARYGFVKR